MSSNVGNSAIYENGDQKNLPRSELNNAEPYHEGKENSHNTNDSKDQASLKNNLARAEHDHKKADYKSPETVQLQQDPTKPAQMHGNEPSKGAKIDAEIKAEEEEILKKKGAAH